MGYLRSHRAQAADLRSQAVSLSSLFPSQTLAVKQTVWAGSWAKARVLEYSETNVHKGKGGSVLFITYSPELGQFCSQCVLISYLLNEQERERDLQRE